jgi:hypothetical protein
MVETPFTPELANASSDRRISIPESYRKKIAWMNGGEPLRAWLLTLMPGRFRLLSDLEVTKDPRLAEIRTLIIDGPIETTVQATEFLLAGRAAIIGRLVPISITAPTTSCRLVIPNEVLPESRERWTFVLMFSLGYLEIWILDVYNAALSVSLDSVI